MLARPKAALVRDKTYRQLVASLPCRACGIEGYSQAAHVPSSGKSMKESDDEIFPLCCDRPGVWGCHKNFDNYEMWDAQETRRIGRQWAAETRAVLNRRQERNG